ncbi:MAG: restriction endonuclease subunit S [Desulfobulbus sp.]|jgi:type I restriction enzyme S subunit|uniref:restriction endonuclease subunit S n=1 Tax=Desulfobulbus sp. TaxID=895 RepID=UPI00284EDF9C|nr:restriction endonuclease subunit S [Desulfobulbus sp.]MDR2551112.1 restriction endonuclease subunit S [Desulfobulbus sp.]
MTINQLHLGNLFRSRREPGKPGLPVISVTMHDGLVHRDALDRKDNSTLAPEEHLLVRKGDIAYNMMRMWQGAFGLAETDGIVSPAYVVVIPQKDIDPLFAAYWFKSARMIYLFWAYSYGITGDRLRLYYKDFAQIPVNVPSKPEQERIGRVLATTDRAIAGMDKLIAAKRTLKKGLAQQLLTGKYRLPGFGEPAVEGKVGKDSKCGWIPSDWENVQFGTLGSTYTGLACKTKEDFGDGYPYIPYLNIFDNTYIDPTRMDRVRIGTDERQHTVQYGDIFFTTSSETRLEVGMAAVMLSEVESTYLNSFCFGFRLNSFDRLWPEFAGHLLRGSETRRAIARLSQGATRYNLPQSCIKELYIPLPSLLEQKHIAALLGKADREIALLEKKLAALHELKKGLMQKLLTGPMPAKESA